MKYLMIPVLLGLGLAGCSQAKSDETIAATQPASPAQRLPAATPAAETPLPRPATAAQPGEQPGPAEAVATANAQPGHSVAYQAELKMAVDDFDKATDRVNALLEQHGAYLGTAHETRAEGQRRQDMTLQVPPRQFVALVSALGKLGHIENKDIAAADITADVLATAAQLDEQQAAEAQTPSNWFRPARRPSGPGWGAKPGGSGPQPGSRGRSCSSSARANWTTLALRYYQVLAAPQLPVAPRFREAFGWSLVLELALGLAHAWPALLLAALGAWTLGAWTLRRWRLRPSVPVPA